VAKSLDELTGSYIDSRDIIERLNELESQVHEGETDSLDEYEFAELVRLRALNEEGEGTFEDWHHGVYLIPEDEFEDYARDFAYDIGAINRNASWPLTLIDWKAAAEDLRQDYSSIEIEGRTYYGR
jgi:hypothetical protein